MAPPRNTTNNLRALFPDKVFELRPTDALWPSCVSADLIEASAIYGIGDPEVLSAESLSVVGARRPTPYGTALAKMAGRIAAETGLVTVSGGAMGVDIESAKATLKAKGKNVIVSGTGADIIYPAKNRETFIETVEVGGAVIAIERWESPPRRYAFPKRNKVIAALSRALFVTEAALPSGTMSTAEAAIEMGRALYAAPGSIFSPSSRGTNWLIQEGASIMVDEESLEVAISRDYGTLRRERLKQTKDRGRAMSVLLAQPLRPDELASYLGKELLTVLKTLSEYEVKGLVVRLPDGRYTPSEKILLEG